MSTNYREYMLDRSLQIIKDKYGVMIDSDSNRAAIKYELDLIVFSNKYNDIIYNINGRYFILEKLYYLDSNPLEFKKKWKEVLGINNMDIRFEVEE